LFIVRCGAGRQTGWVACRIECESEHFRFWLVEGSWEGARARLAVVSWLLVGPLRGFGCFFLRRSPLVGLTNRFERDGITSGEQWLTTCGDPGGQGAAEALDATAPGALR